MITEKLPPLSPNSQQKPSNSGDIYLIAQLRGEMMKVQQAIQRLSSDYAQLSSVIPENIAQTINQLESNCNILDSKISSETQRDWISELNQLEANINNITTKFTKYNNKTGKNIHSQQFAKSCSTFEMELNKTNEDFLNNLEKDIMSQIALLKGEIPKETEPEEDPLKFTAMMVEIQEKTSKEKVFVEKHTDPELTTRVRRHTDRVKMVEDLIKYHMNNIVPSQSQPVADIKKKNDELEKILAEVQEKISSLKIDSNTKEVEVVKQESSDEPHNTLTREEMLKFSAEINTDAQNITLEIQQMADQVLASAEQLSSQIDASGKKLHNIALGAEKSLKRAEGIADNVDLICPANFVPKDDVTEEDVKKANKAAKVTVQKVTKDVEQRLKIANEKINKIKLVAIKDELPQVNEPKKS